MARKKMIEINGVRYVIPSVAAGLWGMSSQAITYACADGRISGAFKDSSGKWLIPADAVKPLDTETIRDLLIGILRLKNGNQTLSGSVNIDQLNQVLQYLVDIGCIENITERNDQVQNLKLTDRGMKIATEGRASKFDWLNTAATLVQIVTNVVTVWKAIV